MKPTRKHGILTTQIFWERVNSKKVQVKVRMGRGMMMRENWSRFRVNANVSLTASTRGGNIYLHLPKTKNKEVESASVSLFHKKV